MSLDDLTLFPFRWGGVKAGRVPGSAGREDISGGGYSRHDIDLYRNRTELRMSLPAVNENAGLNDLLYDEGRIQHVASMT